MNALRLLDQSQRLVSKSITGVNKFGAGFIRWAGLMAGLQVGQALNILATWVNSAGPHVPGHPTSICSNGITDFIVYIVPIFGLYVSNGIPQVIGLGARDVN